MAAGWFEAEPHRGRVADQREVDGLAGQRLGFAREQRRGGERRLVAGPGPAADGVARPALVEWPSAHPPRRFWWKPIRHRHVLCPTGGPFRQSPSAGSMQCQFGNFWITIIATK